MKKSDKERLKRIIQIWDNVKAQMEERNITQDQVLHDEFTQWALTTPLYNIGEHVYMLSPELKATYPEIPWSVVSGLRHRLVHDYEGVNWTIIAEVIYEDMETFANQMRDIEKKVEGI